MYDKDESEHDSVTSRMYKENWDDACELLKAKDAKINSLELTIRVLNDSIAEFEKKEAKHRKMLGGE